MTTFDQKRAEWDNQANSTADLKAQVCRPVGDEDWQALIADITNKLLLNEHHQQKFDSILDVGCGNALVLSEFSNDFQQLYGIDYGDSMIANALKTLPHGYFSTGEAAELKFPDQQFDRVLSYSIFHYFPDEDYIYKAINEMIRVTKKGGIILIGDLLDKTFEQEIKSASDLDYEQKLPLILRYSQWTFCDLNKIVDHFQGPTYQNKIKKIEVLNQPKDFKLRHYRKDLRICC